jgi:hypothetical protein
MKGSFPMRCVLLVSTLLALLTGCQRKHPERVFIDPSMKEGTVEKIAVLPFASSLHHSVDPDGVAPRMMDGLFRKRLDERTDYMFSAPTSVQYAIEREGMEEQAKQFVDDWREHQVADQEFLSWLRNMLRVDAVLVGVVDLWQKDEVDVQENAAPATYVGATISIIGVDDGKVLFQASDEDYLEGARSETTDRVAIRSGSGKIYSDPGANVYRAPDYEFVAIKVVNALVRSIPVR